MRRSACLVLAIVSVCIGCSSGEGKAPSDVSSSTGSPGASTTAGTPTTASYSDVQAIFDKSCVKCHGADNPKAGISLVSHEALMKGGNGGPTVVAGDSANSLLIQALRGTNGKKLMPMGSSSLPEEDIAKVETWIKEGARA